jgi:flagellar protein FliO/FliZ
LFELVLRIGFSLAVVLGLMWALARVVRRPLGVGRPHGQLAVLNRQQLTRGATVFVVKVADRAVVLGVTDQHVTSLGEADIADFEKHPPERRDHVHLDDELPTAHPETEHAGRLDRTFAHPFGSTIDFLRDRTTRR